MDSSLLFSLQRGLVIGLQAMQEYKALISPTSGERPGRETSLAAPGPTRGRQGGDLRGLWATLCLGLRGAESSCGGCGLGGQEPLCVWRLHRRDTGLQHPPETGDSGASGWEAASGGTPRKKPLQAHRLFACGRWGPQGGPSHWAGAWRVLLSLRPQWSLEDQEGVRWGGQGGGCLHVWGLGGMCLREGRSGRSTGISRAGLECPAVMTGCLSPTHGCCLQPGGTLKPGDPSCSCPLMQRGSCPPSFLEHSGSALFSPLPPLLSPSPFLSLSRPYSALLSSPQTPSSAIFSC